MLTEATFTAADAYASAASALAHGRDQLAADIEAIGDQLAHRSPVHGWVWTCPYLDCQLEGLAGSPRAAARQYHEHYETEHRMGGRA